MAEKKTKELDEQLAKKLEYEKAIHNLKMERLAYERETNKLFHEWALERGRIQRAEARKDFMEKQNWRRG